MIAHALKVVAETLAEEQEQLVRSQRAKLALLHYQRKPKLLCDWIAPRWLLCGRAISLANDPPERVWVVSSELFRRGAMALDAPDPYTAVASTPTSTRVTRSE